VEHSICKQAKGNGMKILALGLVHDKFLLATTNASSIGVFAVTFGEKNLPINGIKRMTETCTSSESPSPPLTYSFEAH